MAFSMWMDTSNPKILEFHAEHHRNPMESRPCLFCERPVSQNSVRCSECKVVQYCDHRCLRNHLTKHAGPCFKYRQHRKKFKQKSEYGKLLRSALNGGDFSSSSNEKDGRKEPGSCVPKASKEKPVQCSSCQKCSLVLRTCSRCKTVGYCDADCQRKHWPEHKKACKLICEGKTAASSTEDGGSTESKASSDVKTEQGKDTDSGKTPSITTKEEADADVKKPCDQCGKTNPQARKCSKCKTVFYCNAKCQGEHWPIHKGVCAVPTPSGDGVIKCASCDKPNPAAKKCTRCMTVSYCDAQCQKKHWPQHKDTCGTTSSAEHATISKHTNENNGIKESAKNESSSTSSEGGQENSTVRCFSCRKLNPVAKKCTKCHVASYCNVQCQMRDFALHKLSCGNYPKFMEALGRADPLLSSLHDRDVTDMLYPPRIYESMELFKVPGRKTVLLEIVGPFHHFCRLGVYVQDVKGEVVHMLFHHPGDEGIYLLPSNLKEKLKPGNLIRWFYPRWHRFADGEIGFRVDSLHEMEFLSKQWTPFE